MSWRRNLCWVWVWMLDWFVFWWCIVSVYILHRLHLNTIRIESNGINSKSFWTFYSRFVWMYHSFVHPSHHHHLHVCFFFLVGYTIFMLHFFAILIYIHLKIKTNGKSSEKKLEIIKIYAIIIRKEKERQRTRNSVVCFVAFDSSNHLFLYSGWFFLLLLLLHLNLIKFLIYLLHCK